MKQLYHLRDILMLSTKNVNEVIEKETVKVYARHVKKAVSEGVLQDFEKDNLEKLRSKLRISADVAKEIYSKSAGEILQGFIDGAISDERLSPHEERQMIEIARNLGIDLKIDSKSKAVLERYKLYWQIENGTLPEITSDLNIQKSEKLHFSTYVHWMEE